MLTTASRASSRARSKSGWSRWSSSRAALPRIRAPAGGRCGPRRPAPERCPSAFRLLPRSPPRSLLRCGHSRPAILSQLLRGRGGRGGIRGPSEAFFCACIPKTRASSAATSVIAPTAVEEPRLRSFRRRAASACSSALLAFAASPRACSAFARLCPSCASSSAAQRAPPVAGASASSSRSRQLATCGQIRQLLLIQGESAQASRSLKRILQPAAAVGQKILFFGLRRGGPGCGGVADAFAAVAGRRGRCAATRPAWARR